MNNISVIIKICRGFYVNYFFISRFKCKNYSRLMAVRWIDYPKPQENICVIKKINQTSPLNANVDAALI